MKEIKPVVKTRHEGEICYSEDPMKFILEKNLAVQVGEGLFVFKGILVKILNKIEKLICEIAEKMNAEEVLIPCILSWENAKNSQYINSFENLALMVEPFNKSSKQGYLNGEYKGMVSPATCYNYFCSLKNKTVKNNHSVTVISKESRNEGQSNLSRLTNFTVREIVFLGNEKYCLETRKKILNTTLKMLNSVLDLSYKVVPASDPFFGKDSALKKKAQLVLESKYEIQASIPFNKTTISISSFNFHGKIFFDRFNIIPKKPELGYSGCVGFGYERILYAILAQKGVDFSSPYYKRLLYG